MINENQLDSANKTNKITGFHKIKNFELYKLQVFNHHIYEFKKGLRNLVLCTEKAEYKHKIEQRLHKENISYLIQDIGMGKINIFFGAKDSVEVVKSFRNPKLNELSAEQDFILGIMLGYDRLKQCSRYLERKEL